MTFFEQIRAELDAQFKGEIYDGQTLRQLTIVTWRKLIELHSTRTDLPTALPLLDYGISITSPPDRRDHADISLVYRTEKGYRFLMALQAPDSDIGEPPLGKRP